MPWDLANPHRPEIVGPELAPVGDVVDLPIDQSVARVQLASIPDPWPTAPGGAEAFLRAAPAPGLAAGTQHMYLGELFAAGQVDVGGLPTRISMELDAASTTTGALQGGAPNLAAALATAGDGLSVLMTGDQSDCFFDVTPLTAVGNPLRIVSLGIEYQAWNDAPAVNVVEGLQLQWRDLLSGSGFPIVPVSGQEALATIDEWSFGETNPLEAVNNAGYALPWTVAEILLAGAGGASTRLLRFEDTSEPPFGATGVVVDYLRLVAYVLPERRLAVTGWRFSSVDNGAFGAPVSLPSGENVRVWRNPATLVAVGALGLAAADVGYSVREAQAADPEGPAKSALAGPAPTQTAGGPVPFRAIRTVTADALNPQAVPATVLYQDGVAAAPRQLEETLFPSMTLKDNGNVSGTFWPSHLRVLAPPSTQVYAANPQTQTLEAVPLLATYPFVRFLVKKPPATTAPLTVTVGASVASLTAAVYDTLEHVGLGWRQVTLPFAVPLVGAGLDVVATFTSVALQSDPWEVAGTRSREDANYNPPPAGVSIIDVTHVTIHTQPDPPDIVDATEVFTPVVGDAQCCVDQIADVEVTWNPSGSGWDVAIERTYAGAGEWVEVGRVPDGDGTFTDRTAPLGVPLEYRLRECRTVLDNICSDPSPVEAVGPLDDGGCAFVLSTDTTSLAYAPSDPRQVELGWTDRNRVDIVDLHGRDYPTSLREPEQRGLSVSFDAVVEAFGCDSDAEGLSPRPYDVLRELARTVSTLSLRLPDGEVRTVTLTVGRLTTITEPGIHRAEIRLTEVGPHLYAP